MISLTETKKHEIDNSHIKLYTFEELGKIYRVIYPLLGKHESYVKETVQASYYTYKRMNWRWTNTHTPEYAQAIKSLRDIGIIDKPQNYIPTFSTMDENIYPTAFHTSDDPAEWRRIQEEKHNLLKIRHVENQLDRKE